MAKYNQNEARKRAQEKERKVKSLLKGLAENYNENPEVIAEVMAFSSNFYRYSVQNMMLIYSQNPYATYCQSYDRWEKMGYPVKKNEQGLEIWVPVKTTFLKVGDTLVKLSDATAEQKRDFRQGKIEGITKLSFRIGNTFDIAQTTMPPEKYPEFYSVGYHSSTHNQIGQGMIDYAKTIGYDVVLKDLESISLRGTCNNFEKIITINSRLKDTQMLSTLCHELGHAIIEHGIVGEKSTPQKEIEADAVSIILESSYGLELTDARKRHFSQHYQTLLGTLKAGGKEQKLKNTIDNIFGDVFQTVKKQMPEINTCVEKYVSSEQLFNTKIAGQAIKDLRVERGIGIEEMAGVLLMDAKSLEKIEHGRIVPADDTWKLIGDFFRVSVTELKTGNIVDMVPQNISADLIEIRAAMQDIKDDTAYFRDLMASWEIDMVPENQTFYIEKNAVEESYDYVVVDMQTDTCLKDENGQLFTWNSLEDAQSYVQMLEEQEMLQPSIQTIQEYEKSIGRERSMLAELITEEQIRDYGNLCQQFLQWGQGVDQALTGDYNQRNAIKVCDTPPILVNIGFKPLPMHMTKSHLVNCMHEKEESKMHYHGIQIQEIKKMPEALTNPVMVMESLTQENAALVVMGEKDQMGLPIVMSIAVNGKAVYELQTVDSNFITSIYGRENFTSFVERVLDADKMLYIDKKRSEEFALPRLQLRWDHPTLASASIIKHLDEGFNSKTIESPQKSLSK